MVIGLTGPIGCGKSTVAAMLGELGGVVIDADALAHEVTAPGQPTLVAIRDRFGEAVFRSPGLLDRAALAAIVFSDPAALHDLEAIIHPAVRSIVEARLEQAERRLATQGRDLAERLAAHADRRIDTAGSLESVRECVEDALADVLLPEFTGLPWGPVERF